jgi:hypothetical protein
VLAATGCRGIGALGSPPRPAPDVAVLRTAIAAERLMITRYETVMARSARLARALAPLRDEHRLHLAQLRSRLVIPPGSAYRTFPPLRPDPAPGSPVSGSPVSGSPAPAAGRTDGTTPTASSPASTSPASTPPASTPPASTPPASTPPASTPPASTPPASTPPDSAPAPRRGPAGVPKDPGQALVFLETAEAAAAARLLGGLPSASPSLAQLLASVAASETTHVTALRTMASGQ